jgi:hypothetical protein
MLVKKLLMKPVGGCISPKSDTDPICSSNVNVSKYMQWVPKNYNGPVDLELYIDEGIIQGFNVPQKKYGWLLESPGYNARHIEYLKNNIELTKSNYEKIFTCHNELVSLGAPFAYVISNAAPWTLSQNRRKHKKTNLLSMLVSTDRSLPGHRYRLDYMNQNKHMMDVYGRGHNPVEHTDEAFIDYMFTVTMENDITDMYFTERLTSPMTTYTVPIYRGSRVVVEKYFNPKGILFHDEINLNDLNESLYNDMMPYLEENYQRACELKVADDYMVENYFSKTNIL